MSTFQELGVQDTLGQQLKGLGISQPTPVQEQTIPVLLAGQDAIVQAQTGTGKTLAFLLPILQNIDPDKPQVQALIIAPTRELALQITTEAKKLASARGIGVLAVYGGQDVIAQISKLNKSTQIVVATPGRLMDHIRRGTIGLSHVQFLVLDEADQMLAMGFLEEVELIIKKTPHYRRTSLFSATIPAGVRRLAQKYMRSPQDIRVKSRTITLDNIDQLVVETTDRNRFTTLTKLIEQYHPYLAVVFCRTKIRTKKLAEELSLAGFEVDELHGDLTQAKRETVMKRFRDAKLQILVATDVAARGLDVEGVTHVFNYDVPQDAETYIHRIGRTGRAGMEGMAITLVAPKDRSDLAEIERGVSKTIRKMTMQEFGVGVKGNSDGRDIAADRKPSQGSRRSAKTGSTKAYDRSPSKRGARQDAKKDSRRGGTRKKTGREAGRSGGRRGR